MGKYNYRNIGNLPIDYGKEAYDYAIMGESFFYTTGGTGYNFTLYHKDKTTNQTTNIATLKKNNDLRTGLLHVSGDKLYCISVTETVIVDIKSLEVIKRTSYNGSLSFGTVASFNKETKAYIYMFYNKNKWGRVNKNTGQFEPLDPKFNGVTYDVYDAAFDTDVKDVVYLRVNSGSNWDVIEYNLKTLTVTKSLGIENIENAFLSKMVAMIYVEKNLYFLSQTNAFNLYRYEKNTTLPIEKIRLYYKHGSYDVSDYTDLLSDGYGIYVVGYVNYTTSTKYANFIRINQRKITEARQGPTHLKTHTVYESWFLSECYNKGYLKAATPGNKNVYEFTTTRPIISDWEKGNFINLGKLNKDYNLEFSITHEDTTMKTSVKILLDGEVIEEIPTVTYGQKYSKLIPISPLEAGQEHDIEIIATDSWGDTSIQNRTFEKMNDAPIIITDIEEGDLGDVTEDIEINYSVEDVDLHDKDKVKLYIYLNDLEIDKYIPIKLGEGHNLKIPLTSVELNKINTLKFVATDFYNAKSELEFKFRRINSPPTISGKDENLGDKKEPFKISYLINDLDVDDTVSLEIKIADKVYLSEEITELNKEKTFEVTKEILQLLDLNKEYVISIKAEDNNGSITYRYYTFTRINSLPEIVVTTNNLGDKEEEFSIKSKITDLENDDIYIWVTCSQFELIPKQLVKLNEEIDISINRHQWLRLDNRKTHTITIHALEKYIDDNESLNNEDYIVKSGIKFNRVCNKIRMIIPLETNKDLTSVEDVEGIMRKYFLLNPKYIIAGGAKLKVEVCNNYNDKQPTWEDITKLTGINSEARIRNRTKTADKWGLALRVTLYRNNAVDKSRILEIKGAYS